MNSRQRLLNVFDLAEPDRTPVTMFVTDTDIQDGPPNCVIGERSDDVIADLIRFHEVLGIDIMLRVGIDVFEPVGFDRENAQWENIWEFSDGRSRLTHRIVTPGGELSESFNLEGEDFHGDPTKDWMKLRNVRTEALIKKPDDLELVRRYRPALPEYDFSDLARIQNRLGDRGIVLPRVPSSVFNSAYGLRKLEDLLTDPVLNPEFYADLMELCTADVIAVGMRVAQAAGDVMRVVGNVANSAMVGAEFYRRHILPFEKQYIDALAGAGRKVLFHNCGRCAGLLEVYREMLAGHALESLSPPACGGDIEDLAQARQKLGGSVVMVGNFDQVQLLKNGTPSQIKQQVRRIFEQAGKDPLFIFSTSDSIIPGTPAENIRALAEAALECAG